MKHNLILCLACLIGINTFAQITVGNTTLQEREVIGNLEIPWEIKLTASNRDISCSLRKWTALLSLSENRATIIFAPLTSFLPDDCTWMIDLCTTRWKPAVGFDSSFLGFYCSNYFFLLFLSSIFMSFFYLLWNIIFYN